MATAVTCPRWTVFTAIKIQVAVFWILTPRSVNGRVSMFWRPKTWIYQNAI